MWYVYILTKFHNCRSQFQLPFKLDGVSIQQFFERFRSGFAQLSLTKFVSYKGGESCVMNELSEYPEAQWAH